MAERVAIVGEVEEDSSRVGEDEESAVREEMDERIEVVLGVDIAGIVQEREGR